MSFLRPIAIDMGLQTEDGILNHKNTQADKLMENITSAHRPSLAESVKEAQKQLRQMPNQLYVQTVLMIRLVATILQRASLYYVQRRPRELGRFRWVVDAKDKKVTPCEEFWKKITLPALQTISLREPICLLKGADYTSFKPFHGEMAKTPEHLRKAAGDDDRPFVYMEINKIMEDLSFENSEKENGLQLVDILCNAIQRAMNGNLQPLGWEMIGCLTVSAQLERHVIQLTNLCLGSPSVIAGGTVPYTSVVRLVDRLAKPMILKSAYQGAAR